MGRRGKKLTVDQDVAATDELAVDVDLRDGGPIGVLLDAFPQLLVLEAVECFEEFRLDTLDLHDLDDCAGETAHGHVGSTFHKDDQRVALDGSIDLASCFGREEAKRVEGVQGGSRVDAARVRQERCTHWSSALLSMSRMKARTKMQR